MLTPDITQINQEKEKENESESKDLRISCYS